VRQTGWLDRQSNRMLLAAAPESVRDRLYTLTL
jgi:hypothetical protein